MIKMKKKMNSQLRMNYELLDTNSKTFKRYSELYREYYDLILINDFTDYLLRFNQIDDSEIVELKKFTLDKLIEKFQLEYDKFFMSQDFLDAISFVTENVLKVMKEEKYY